MSEFRNQMFAPMDVNGNYYQPEQMQTMRQYEQEQNEKVQKAVKAGCDFVDAMDKLDPQHQQQALCECFGIVALKLGWSKESNLR